MTIFTICVIILILKFLVDLLKLNWVQLRICGIKKMYKLAKKNTKNHMKGGKRREININYIYIYIIPIAKQINNAVVIGNKTVNPMKEEQEQEDQCIKQNKTT